MLTLERSSPGGDARQRDPVTSRPEPVLGHRRVLLAEVDGGGRFLLVDGPGLAACGLVPGEVVGRTVQDACSGHPAIVDAFRDALAGRGSTRAVRCADLALELEAMPVAGPDGRVERVLAVAHDVTDLLRAAAERTETEARLRDFAQASGDWLWQTDAEHRFTALSPRFEGVMGIALSSMLGRRRWDNRADDPADGDWAAHIRTMEARQPFRDFTYGLRDAAGRRRVLRVSGVPVSTPDGAFCGYRGVGRDVTFQIEAEEALRASEDRFRSLVTNLRGIVFCRGLPGEAEHGYQQGAVQVYGLDAPRITGAVDERGQLVVSAWYAAIHPDDFPAYQAAERGQVERHEPFALDYRIIHPRTGETRWIREVAWVVKDPAHDRVSFDSYMLDITEQKHREAALREAQGRLERQAAEMRGLAEAAQRASQAKSEFLAMMSHEIRTPMNGVLGALGLLSDRQLAAEDRFFVDTARGSAEALLTILNDILDFSKVEAGKLELEPTVFSIEELVRSVTDLCRIQARAKGLQLEVAIAPEVPRFVRGDAGRVRQMLLNYTSNAIKFTSAGAVAIHVEPASAGPDSLRLTVVDSGVGIAPGRRHEVFRDFTQLDRSIARRHGGTGLGLAITKRLAEFMGGSVGFDSEPGAGSRFWFEVPLPRAAAPEAALEPEAAGNLPRLTVAGRRPRLLLVEDNRTNQLLAKALLERMGCEVTVAADGIEAIDAVTARPFDLVLMDISMPVMDGMEATRRLRAMGKTLPILALTATAEKDGRARMLAAGFDDYLIKPVGRPALRRALTQALCGAPAQPPAEEPISRDKLDALLREIGPEILNEALRAAVGDIHSYAAACGEAIGRGDREALGRSAHALAGVAGMVGVGTLERHARALMDDVQAGRPVDTAAASRLAMAAAAACEHINDTRAGLR